VAEYVQTGGVVAQVFAITVVPLAIGMAIRARRTRWALEHEDTLKRFALVAFLLVVIGAVSQEFETLADNFASLAAATLTLNVLAMACSFAIARLAQLDLRQATAVAMELGVHNGTLAIAVGALIADVLTIPAAVYSAFMFITAGLFARLMYRRNEQVARSPAGVTAEPAA